MSEIVSQREGRVAVVTLNRPEVLNAINTPMLDALDDALDAIEQSDAELLVLTGAGRAFCAGSDIGGHRPAGEDLREVAETRVRRMHALVLRFIGYRLPSVAAINGLAYGGGLELALACTFRVAAPTATLCMPEIKHGVLPSYGATQLLPRLIGASRALELMLTGASLAGEDAKPIGLVTGVDAAPLAAAIAFADRLPNAGSLSHRMIRHAVHHGQHLDLAAALELERELAIEVAVSDEAREGISKFGERS